MRVIRYADVDQVLSGREQMVTEIIRQAYLLHWRAQSVVPPSSFLRFPGDRVNRIIALLAFLGGEKPAAGMKWIASFPGNLDHGLPRASATIVLNSVTTGHPIAVIEGSLISARRTAASAVLGASLLADGQAPGGASLIGCGVINFEVLRFALAAWPGLASLSLFDADPARAAAFGQRAALLAPSVQVTCVPSARDALLAHDLTFIATTAVEPHIGLEGCGGKVIVHVSLRDIRPESILASQNVVDDADHVCREGTSLHLAEAAVGHRRFISASIGQLLESQSPFRRSAGAPVIFSPFGLGVLDIALAQYVCEQADAMAVGVSVADFGQAVQAVPA
ncbi:MAG TPA: 2,3-diaminopropionate biosynthesis protein SbnB [Streptosporangiaceae bacterium]|jgi:N-[(2S)-2-amino-2-carboxyethyl]-L-glutamate dehydrogenase|nr:2,3-diaminopropionate biosynthesis protein SbnB [Streptosporangiaceae bacterium]